MDLQGKTAIVTGAGSGIGRAIAQSFGAAGAKVVCAARRTQRIEATAQAIRDAGGEAMAVTTDVTDLASVDAMVAAALDAFGRLDVLFNNAGSFDTIGGLWEVDPEAWWRDVTVNLRGPMLCSRAALAPMMKQNEGVILNMDGGGSGQPLAGGSAYGSSKAALLRFTETLARELEREGSAVMIMALGPGFVRTEMTELQADTEMGRKWLPGARQAFEEGRHVPPERCANAAVKLLSIAQPALNGRIFGAGDDFDAIAREAASIQEQDGRVLRYKWK